MAKTLAQVVADVRVDLGDTDAGNYRWTDTALQRFVDRARARVQEVMPRERTADMVASAGVRTYSLAAVTDLLWVGRVLFDVGGIRYPPVRAPFEVWNGQLTLLLTEAPAGGETFRLFYAGAHTVDGSGNTLPPEREGLLALGAAVYAAMEAGAAATGRFGASTTTPADWRTWLDGRLRDWEAQLDALRRAAALRGASFTAGWPLA